MAIVARLLALRDGRRSRAPSNLAVKLLGGVLGLRTLTGLALLAGSAVGLLACALLAVNNLRDIAGDTVSGKRTLAVRIGDRAARWLYVAFLDGALVIASLCALSRPWCLLVLGGGVVAGPAVRDVLGGAEGPRLIGVLAVTARTQLVAGSLLALGLVLSA